MLEVPSVQGLKVSERRLGRSLCVRKTERVQLASHGGRPLPHLPHTCFSAWGWKVGGRSRPISASGARGASELVNPPLPQRKSHAIGPSMLTPTSLPQSELSLGPCRAQLGKGRGGFSFHSRVAPPASFALDHKPGKQFSWEGAAYACPKRLVEGTTDGGVGMRMPLRLSRLPFAHLPAPLSFLLRRKVKFNLI